LTGRDGAGYIRRCGFRILVGNRGNIDLPHRPIDKVLHLRFREIQALSSHLVPEGFIAQGSRDDLLFKVFLRLSSLQEPRDHC
jgi:hypothetical protein